MKSVGKSILHGTMWSLFGQVASMLVALISNILLARILTPFQFGQVGIIMFFIGISAVFTESGLAGALVRRKEVTKEDYGTVFLFNFVVSITCLLLLILFSGPISRFYNDPQLKNILVVSSFILIINAFQITQNVRLVRSLNFKKKSIYRFVAVLLSSIIGVVLAYLGFGVYSIVIMQLLAAMFTTILLWIFEHNAFYLSFNKASFKSLYAFGVNTTAASLLDTAFTNIYQLILGKYFSIAEVGLFYQAKKLQEIPVGVINLTTQNVIFAALAKLQDDIELFRKTYNKIVLLFTVGMGLLTAVIYTFSESIILLLYGPKWVGGAFYMQLLTVASFFYMQELLNRIIFKVFNQTRKILFLEVIKKIVQTVSIVVGLWSKDLTILLYGFVVSSVISYFINFYYSRKIIGGAAWFEVIILLKVVAISVAVVLTTLFLLNFFSLTGSYKFILLPLLMLLYVGLVYLSRTANLYAEFKSVKSLIRKK